MRDIDADDKESAYKLPITKKSIVLDSAYYRIVDKETNTVVVPFDKERNSTKLSTDSDGMYISFLSSGLAKDRSYTIDILANDQGVERLIRLNDISFMVV